MNFNDPIRPCDVTSIYAEYLDCCLPGYFSGNYTAEEVLAVPVWANMTYREAYEAAKDEFHQSSGYFDSVDGSGTLAEDAIHALFASFITPDTDEPADFAKYIEPAEDNGETVYLYIGLYAESDIQ